MLKALSKTVDVSSICNALVDIVVNVSDEDLRRHKLTKARMHLVEPAQQETLLAEFQSHEQTIELGGSALNAIRALSALSLRTAFGGAVAPDAFGRRIRARLGELGIRETLRDCTGEATGSCLVLVTPDAERTMVTCPGASRLYTRDSIPREDIAASRIFHFCGYQWDTANQREAITGAITLAEKSGCLISFDLADPFVVTLHREDCLRIVEEHADVVFANREEISLLYPDLTPEEAARKIAQTGALAAIELGADGALLVSSKVQGAEEFHRIAPYPTDVVDSTAAGDMFAAGMLFGLSRDLPLELCGRMAARLASDVISRYGAAFSEHALAELRRMASTTR